MLRELTKDEFLATFDPHMRFIEEEDDSYGPFPIADYVERCITALSLPTDRNAIEIHHVYLNDKQGFCHVLFNWGAQNVYLVVVTRPVERAVHGHYVLDLNMEYGLYGGQDA